MPVREKERERDCFLRTSYQLIKKLTAELLLHLISVWPVEQVWTTLASPQRATLYTHYCDN